MALSAAPPGSTENQTRVSHHGDPQPSSGGHQSPPAGTSVHVQGLCVCFTGSSERPAEKSKQEISSYCLEMQRLRNMELRTTCTSALIITLSSISSFSTHGRSVSLQAPTANSSLGNRDPHVKLGHVQRPRRRWSPVQSLKRSTFHVCGS